MDNFIDRKTGPANKDISFRETDKNEIIFDNMKFLSPETSADLYKVLSKINQQHIPVYSLAKSELGILFYGHIFTCSVDSSGTNRIPEAEMKLYSEFMSECYHNKFSDVEMFIYHHLKDIPEDERYDFSKKAEDFRLILSKFERILGRKDKI